MGLLKRLFSRSGRTRSLNHAARDRDQSDPRQARIKKPAGHFIARPIALETLEQLIPIRNLSEEELIAFSLEQKSEVCGAGSILFERNETDDFVLYLLEGTVVMETGEGRSYEIIAGTAKARFPLSYGKQHSATAYAKTDVRILRVSDKIMRVPTAAQQTIHATIDAGQVDLPGELKENSLLQAFCQHYGSDELVLPSLPDVAFKIRKALQNEALSMKEAVKIVQLDPIAAAKLVHVANSPLYLAAKPANTCFEAVKRLGLNATRNLVTGISLKQVFQTKHQYLRQRMQSLWKQSIHVSSLCFVLAKENHWPDPDEALLAGLIADIGIVPFLCFADNFPEQYYDARQLDLAIPFVRGPVGTSLLTQWDFAKELAQIPLLAENWYYDSGAELALSDIVMLSKLHSYIGTPKMAELPPINAIPACSKLKDGILSPEHSLKVLHNAKDQVNQVLKFFES